MSSLKSNPKYYFQRKPMRMRGYDYSKKGLYFVTIDCKNMECHFGSVIKGHVILSDFGKVAFDEWLKLSSRFENFQLDTFQIMPNHMHAIVALINLEAVPLNTGETTLPLRVGEAGAPLCDGEAAAPLCDGEAGAPLCDGEAEAPLCDGEAGAPLCDGEAGVPQCDGEAGAPQCDGEAAAPLCNAEAAAPLPDAETLVPLCNAEAGASPANTISVADRCKMNVFVGSVSPSVKNNCKNLSEIIGSYKSIVANACLEIHKQKFAGMATAPLLGKIWKRGFYDHIIRDVSSYKSISRYIRNNPKKWTYR